MFIQRMLPKTHYAVVDRSVISNLELSDGAVRLYAFLFGIFPSGNYTDGYLLKALGISLRGLARRKKELKDQDLLITEQIGPRVYHAYLGTGKLPASEVMSIMKQKDLIGDSENE